MHIGNKVRLSLIHLNCYMLINLIMFIKQGIGERWKPQLVTIFIQLCEERNGKQCETSRPSGNLNARHNIYIYKKMYVKDIKIINMTQSSICKLSKKLFRK